jgi:cysteine synthase
MDGRAIQERFGIGRTALIPLPGLARRGRVTLKAEYANPFGSVKDRTAAYLIAWALDTYGSNVRVVESTSGNLGLALARIGCALGLQTTLVMDESLPETRIRDARDAGAEVELVRECRPGLTFRDTRIALAAEIGSREGSVWLNQYSNLAGMRAHQEGTGPEIWEGAATAVDAVVASVGTGGTICGISAARPADSRAPLIVGVEPIGSTIFGGSAGDYLPAGSGMRGVPGIIKECRTLINICAQVPDNVAAHFSVTLRDRFGLRIGLTTGAAVAVAVLLAERDACHVVAIAPDHGDAFEPAMRKLVNASPSPAPDLTAVHFGEISSVNTSFSL